MATPPTKNTPVIDLPTRPAEDCKVLVVDDDERIVDVLSAILARDGYQILSARLGRGALDIIASERPDVVVLDVILPDLDGIEVCRLIKQNPKTHFLPVILVTGWAARARQLDGLVSGADDFLNKPIDPFELTARVRSLLRTKQLYDEVETHRHELEKRVAERTQELSNAYERLHQLSRVKGNVLAIVSHELRTPLLKIKSGLWLSLRDEIDPEQRATAVKTVEEAFSLLEYRIADIGVFSDPADLKLSPVSVSDLVTGAIEQVRILRPRQDGAIQLDIPKNLPPVMVDAASMMRALAHIIDNALKFGNDKAVLVSAVAEPKGVQLSVRDQGMGMSDGVKAHLFVPLQQGDDSPTRRHGGMGIGLALVKMILDAHQIGISVESQVDQGTTVSLILPPAKIPSE
jgi:signal transduction histidine kinase